MISEQADYGMYMHIHTPLESIFVIHVCFNVRECPYNVFGGIGIFQKKKIIIIIVCPKLVFGLD